MPYLSAVVSQLYDFCLCNLLFKAWKDRFSWREVCSTQMRVTPSTPLQALKRPDLPGFPAGSGECMGKTDMFFNYSMLNLFPQNTLLQLLNEHILRSLFDQCGALATGFCREGKQIPEFSLSTGSPECSRVCNYGSGLFSDKRCLLWVMLTYT